jgi:hypothetical protein
VQQVAKGYGKWDWVEVCKFVPSCHDVLFSQAKAFIQWPNYEGNERLYSFKGTQQPMQNMGVPYLDWPSFDEFDSSYCWHIMVVVVCALGC